MIRMIRNPAVMKVAARAGLDFVMLDMEHGGYTMETVADMASVARGVGVGCLVRVPELAKSFVSRALDAGCDGLMVPMVSDVKQARALAAWAKYPPVGGRGLGSIGEHTSYQSVSDPESFFEDANTDTLCIAQIETVSAIDQIDEIAAVDGIDALLIGPNDLAISYGVAGKLDSPVIAEAVGKVASAARKHTKIFGLHAPDAMIERWLSEGLSLVMSSLDLSFIGAALKSIAEKYGEPR
jgi:2-keto-3-deoxy-L-rhamnonate aldolase RhmA